MLSRWCLDDRLRCVVHAFFAVEALGKVALRQDLAARTLTEEAYAKLLKIDHVRNWRDILVSRVKKEMIFHQDAETYKKAKDISDAYEHSYKDFNELRIDAEDIITTTAAHIRRAILECLQIGSETKSILLSDEYVSPKGPPRVAFYIFGRLVGKSEELAAPSEIYPILKWKHQRVPQKDHETGLSRHSVRTTIEPLLAKGLSFQLSHIELWDGSSFHEADPTKIREAPQQITIDVDQSVLPKIVGEFVVDASDREMAYNIGSFILNTNSFGLLLRALVEIIYSGDKPPGPRMSMRSLGRCMLDRVRGRDGDQELEALLERADHIAKARQAISEGILLIGWKGEPKGKPEVEMLVGPSRRRHARPLQLSRKDISKLVDEAAALAQDLQTWLTARSAVEFRGHHWTASQV